MSLSKFERCGKQTTLCHTEEEAKLSSSWAQNESISDLDLEWNSLLQYVFNAVCAKGEGLVTLHTDELCPVVFSSWIVNT